MARYRTRIQTSMSHDEAFDFMADLRNFENWDPGVSSSEQVKGDGPGPEAAYEVVANGITLTYVTGEYDRPRRVVAEANTDRLRSYDVITIEATSGGCVVTYDALLELKGFYQMFGPLMSLMFRRIGSRADEGLQKALDGTKVD